MRDAYSCRSVRVRACLVALAVSLLGLTTGCTGVPRTSPRGVATTQPKAAGAARPTAPPPAPDANLSGALDARTLRMALYDLAIIFDTMGRLEQVQPELKAQMLSELAEADATTTAAVVKRWRARLLELQQAEADLRLVAAEAPVPASPGPQRNVNTPRTVAPVPTFGVETLPEATDPSAGSGQQSTLTTPPLTPGAPGLRSTHHAPPPAPWNEQLRSLLGQARERAGDAGPDDRRTRMQLALLELLWQTEQNREEAKASDTELWNQLAPAVRFALGAGPHDAQSYQAALHALAGATERLRGPARLEARNLTFCKRVRGFGNIERAEPGAFRPGQPVLVYNEVEKLVSEPAPDGFHSRLSSELELLNAQRETVWHQQFAAVEDRSSVVRHDYFLSHSFRLPATLKPGEYSLRITLHDELARRSASSAISLVVR